MSVLRLIVPAAAGGLCVCASAMGVTNPFTETFSSPSANWSSAAAFTALSYPSSGGPDGSGYGSAAFGFGANSPGDQLILFRAQSSFGSSGNAFVGNWIGAGVTSFSFSIRDNSSAPIDLFARFAPAAGPGVVAFPLGASLQPNTWTTYTVAIDPSTPFIYEGTSFGVFSNIDQVQIGLSLPAGLAGQPGPFAFDVDNVSITPAPGAGVALLGAAGLAAVRRRRRAG